MVGGALAVAASFLVLLAVSPETLEKTARLRYRIGHVPHGLRLTLSLLSFVFFLALVIAGFIGSRDPLSNPLPLTVWTLLWVGLTLLQGVLGNIWRLINPWYGPWRLMRRQSAVETEPSVLRLPAWVGIWPAVGALLVFAWFELIYPAPDDPARLAWAAGSYWLFSFVMMLLFGFEEWSRRGEFLSVFLRMMGNFGIVQGDRDEAVFLRLPGSKLAETRPLDVSGTIFLLFALASVSFDGFSKTFFWFWLNGLNPLEFPGRTALMHVNSIGLVGACLVLAGLFFACVVLGEWLSGRRATILLAAGTLVWSIVPIALAYHFSHYLTLLLVNGQYAAVALSDPFSLGWDLFGTAQMPVMAGIAAGSDAAWVIWNAQAAAIVGGHVLAVLVAHLLAYRLYGVGWSATRGQLPLTLLMIAYTVFGLWLLATPTAA